jgi:hypothetical protein
MKPLATDGIGVEGLEDGEVPGRSLPKSNRRYPFVGIEKAQVQPALLSLRLRVRIARRAWSPLMCTSFRALASRIRRISSWLTE